LGLHLLESGHFLQNRVTDLREGKVRVAGQQQHMVRVSYSRCPFFPPASSNPSAKMGRLSKEPLL
jgi:hypothetical protein